MSTEKIASLHAEVNRLRHELRTTKAGEEAPAAAEQITVGDYLLERLAQLGVTDMFGVPGDFNLGFLDLVEDHKAIEWAGNCNELNAAYAADGYARVKAGTPGVITTTFGVGELSAINGIAGAFSEHVPIVHIVGVPSTGQLKNKPLLHHTLGDGRFDAYMKASEQFTISHAYLMKKETAATEIDRILTDCMVMARPVYLSLPTDIVYERVSAARLQTPLSHEPPENDKETEDYVLDEIVNLAEKANGDVVVIVDACAVRHGAKNELKEFLETTHFPVYASPMGKTAINENYERYGGIYIGSLSHPEVKNKVESAKLILDVGGILSDFNTGNFTYHIPKSRAVELHSDHTRVIHALYPGIGMKRLLPNLTTRLQHFKSNQKSVAVPRFELPLPQEHNEIISHAWFWPRVGQFIKPRDIIIAETGTSSFGVLEIPFPEGAIVISQILWGSIGFATGATLGAALAGRQLNMGRPILFIGDGSLQVTAQELSTMIMHDLKPIIFVLNNRGYTIERYLHGPQRKYNNVSNWKWTSLLESFSETPGITKSYSVSTKTELDKLLLNPEFAGTKKMQLVEVCMPQLDAPLVLQRQAELSNKTNHYSN
jgi:pyruvate decarboxylase